MLRVAGPSATIERDGAVHEAPLIPRLPGGPPVAGDLVDVRDSGAEPVVQAVRPRRTELRRGVGRELRPRPLAANADLLVVVASAVDPPFRPRFVDRYLVAGIDGGLDTALVVTKTDLPHDDAGIAALTQVYRPLGPVLIGDARLPALARDLASLIDGRLAVLAGPSGSGKSTLTRHLTGVERAIGAVSRKAGTGRHTTSDPRLIPLAGGGGVIDTAGVRAFHLARMERGRIEAGFPEIAALAGSCRFATCRHDGDAGCAVEGAVSDERLDSYRRLLAAQDEAARHEKP